VVAAWLSTAGSTSAAANANPGAASPQSRARVRSTLMKLAPLVFLLLLTVGLSIFTNVLLDALHALTGAPLADAHGQPIGWRDHYAMLTRSQALLSVLLAVGFVVLSWVTARYVNINTFSLHGMYRDRLVRLPRGFESGASRVAVHRLLQGRRHADGRAGSGVAAIPRGQSHA
jgi:hypothetical protein